MWPLRRINSAPPRPRPPGPRNFSCSSFKDIQYLCTEEAEPQTGSGSDSPRSPTIFHRPRIFSWAHRKAAVSPPPTRGHHHSSPSSLESKLLPGSSDKEKPAVVVYFTSLRVVRKTFDDCRAVRSILRGLRAPVDERDLSMDSRFVAELQGILGRRRLSLPCVFVRGRLVGGAEEVRKLHESGELRALVAGVASPAAGPGPCRTCGGLKYAVCERCSGSRKIYSDKHGFKSCKACNVNGLIRCPSCSFAAPDLDPICFA
ncbi:uncharacterized protein At5g39865-like [Rhodamnia argentea]|uniref:Uncharacterized protein At5g39865-like n=1 Tax=Rhodamnia argentea TaxID=178133 RepID=A0ABM3HDF9_9MYRT|nr:uncharacterized protein At5g39865-like [Rhodamnia argentea]